ncbi:hypothetical protein Vadar_025147 [Vaccinium darrowii]|uniref:Uncharacterized protein n=1 Tax=Vaccinium darrowii TaxID=229202 RepID=A0ACB7XK39_9ERIC|nr:hypothetical protein Vadar_025147 [Vaccinium darrowii]
MRSFGDKRGFQDRIQPSRGDPFQQISSIYLRSIALLSHLLTVDRAPQDVERTDMTELNDDMDDGYCDMDLSFDMGTFLLDDNDDELESLMKSPIVKNGFVRYSLPSFMDRLCCLSAMKCATALLEGKLGITADVNGHFMLHHAVSFRSPELVQLFLRHGARPDVRLVSSDTDNGLLPLQIALKGVSQKVTGDSIYKMIVALCLPKMKSALATCKLLSGVSNNIQEEAYYDAMEGKLSELAALLIVARENVLLPITFHETDSSGLSGRMTIPECIRNQVFSLLDMEAELNKNDEPGKLAQIQEKIVIMRSTALLLEIFERAGHIIEEYMQSQQPDVETEKVERDVALMLKEAGFTLKFGDFEFSISNWLNRCNHMTTPIKCMETLSDRSLQLTRHHSPLMQQTKLVFPARIGIHSGGGWPRPLTSPFHQTHALSSMMNINQVPNSAWGSRYRTSFHVPVKKETKAKGNVPKCLSTENLARVAMLLKKGVRAGEVDSGLAATMNVGFAKTELLCNSFVPSVITDTMVVFSPNGTLTEGGDFAATRMKFVAAKLEFTTGRIEFAPHKVIVCVNEAGPYGHEVIVCGRHVICGFDSSML